MELNHFLDLLCAVGDDEELTDFCRKKVLHGTPRIFADREDDYYEFRKRISEKFDVGFHEVFITGSAKLGFSPFKGKEFGYDSDIDVAIVSKALYEKVLNVICRYQMELRRARRSVSIREINIYHEFLEYTAIGWIRPDKLPFSFRVGELKNKWFDFFRSVSYGKSEVGNYKVSAGIFKAHKFFEQYTVSGLKELKQSLKNGGRYVSTDQTVSHESDNR